MSAARDAESTHQETPPAENDKPDFHKAYEGAPPWDIGRPQPDLLALFSIFAPGRRVLDLGCGTGEHALWFAERGHEAWGVDMVPRAIERAREKCAERGLDATFEVADALDLPPLGGPFDVIVDSGLFHAFEPAKRGRYLRSLEATLKSGGRLFLLAMSDEHEGPGPPGLTDDELREVFDRPGWDVEYLRPARLVSTVHENGGALAWVAAIGRTPG